MITIADILGKRIVEELSDRQELDRQREDLERQRRAIEMVMAQNIEDLPFICEAVRVCMNNLEEHYRAQRTAAGHQRELAELAADLAQATKKLEYTRADTASVAKNLVEVYLTSDPDLMAQHLNAFDHDLWPAVFPQLNEAVKASFADGVLGHIELHPHRPIDLD